MELKRQNTFNARVQVFYIPSSYTLIFDFIKTLTFFAVFWMMTVDNNEMCRYKKKSELLTFQ